MPITAGEAKKVLFVSLEEYEDNRVGRNAKQLERLEDEGILSADDIDSNYKIVTEAFPRYLNNKESMRVFEDLIKAEEPDVVIIDSLSRMYTGAIESSEMAQKTIHPIKDLVESFQIPFIVIHHTTKLKGEELTMDSMAGSRFLAQEADSIIGVGKTKNGLRYVKKLACRYSDDSNDTMPVFSITGDATIDHKGNFSWEDIQEMSDERYGSENQTQLVEYLKENCDSTVSQLEFDFVTSKVMSRSAMYDNLSKLKKKGIVTKASSGVYRHKDCGTITVQEQSSTNDDEDSTCDRDEEE